MAPRVSPRVSPRARGAAPIVVFVGPSFPPARAREIVPSAEVRPPIRRGDLEGVPPLAVVGLIDGVFDAELAVSPREIRRALARGVRILGASSMGALRAAEVPGMVGVGRIYEMVRSGVVESDDEVAVLLDADSGRALTEPLVNVRFAVERLVAEGSLATKAGHAIVEAALRLHFHDRVYRNILRHAGFAEGPETDVLVAALRAVDLKREDAFSLLERLEAFAAAPAAAAIPALEGPGPKERADDDGDAFSRVRARRRARADAPVLLWELGDRIDFHELVTFLAATGQLDAYARRAAARFLIDDGSIAAPRRPSRTPPPSVQDAFATVVTTWGWRSPEEVHVTLEDLGLGQADLQERFREERELRCRLLPLYERRPATFLRALRGELFLNDLALKRQALRLGALRGLAAMEANGGAVTSAERDDAKRALLGERPELTWDGLLDEGGLSDADAAPVVELVARARRVGVPLSATMDAAPFAEGTTPAAVELLPEAPRARGGKARSVPDDESARLARGLAKVIGVTRVAQLGELERLGVHIAAAYRPSEWSSTLGGGKGASPEGAVAGAVMEEVEKYCQERFEPDVVATGRHDELAQEGAVDPRSLALPYDTSYGPPTRLPWTWAHDLVSGHPVKVPTAVLSVRRAVADPLFSPRRGTKIFSTNGLASAFTVTEALVHATCERIERHALKLAEQALSNPGHMPGAPASAFAFLDLPTCPPSVREVVGAMEQAGYKVRILDVTSEVTVPTFSVRLLRVAEVHGLVDRYCSGSCAHANPEIAVLRALYEAAQTRIAGISGAREDLSLKARSLGRHERPRPLSRGDAYWIRPHVPKKPFSAVGGFVGESARADLAYLVRRLTAAGFGKVLYRELSTPEVAPARVVRVLVPGIEDTNPFHTGLRARAKAVADLLYSHDF